MFNEPIVLRESAALPLATLLWPSGVGEECGNTARAVAVAGGIAIERSRTVGRVKTAARVAKERILTLSGVVASVRCWRDRSRRRRKRNPSEAKRQRGDKKPRLEDNRLIEFGTGRVAVLQQRRQQLVRLQPALISLLPMISLGH